ncbi:MAG: multiheme c-type cytochrome [Planctomycetota bacterium]
MRALWIVPFALVLTGLVTAQGDLRKELHLGAGSCAAQACHGGGFESRMEYKIWATRDPHSRAYAALRSETGQRMAKRLGYDVTMAEACLCCHGTTGVDLADTFDQADGVSCEICHGGAKEWLGPHVEEEWRRKRPDAKETEFGLRDLSTPAKRVAQCVACHVGTKQRPMTHEIMAAGHPPIGFDGGSFPRAVTPHWNDDRDLTLESWLEGLRAAAVAELDRLVVSARDRRKWIEFSVFDCYSCHHPIYQGTVYEQKQGTPGALRLDLAALRVLAAVAERARGFESILARTIAPNADPRELADEAEAAARKLRALDLGRPDPDRWRANLKAAFGRNGQSRNLMRQLAWAVDALAPTRDDVTYKVLLESVDPKHRYDAARSAALGIKALESASSR